MVKLDKSWTITLATIIIAISSILLPSFGITTITESQITNLVFMALGISSIGAGNKAIKRIAEQKKTKSNSHGWYNVDFIKTQKGNGINHNTSFLTITSDKVKSYFTVVLRDANLKVLQIGQGNKTKPVILNLITKVTDGVYSPYPIGKYTLQVTGDYGSSDSVSITDEFEII